MKANMDMQATKPFGNRTFNTREYVLEYCSGYLIYDNVLHDHITMAVLTIYTKLTYSVCKNKAIQNG